MYDPLRRCRHLAAGTLLAFFVLICPIAGQTLLVAGDTDKSNGTGTSVSRDPENPSHPPKRAETAMKVKFDDSSPGVVFVEVGGERIRIDTARRAVETVSPQGGESVSVSVESPASPTVPVSSQAVSRPAASEKEQEESAYDFDKGDEPYDYRLINVPTPKSVPKGTWNLAFTHRFTQPVHPVSSSARNLFGLDSFGIASFGITYGITDKLSVSAYRSPLCERGLCRVIEVGLGYSILEQDKESPFALSAYVSVEGNGNFTEEYTYNLQARASYRAGKRVYLFFSPAVHINANGQRRFDPRASDFFPPAVAAKNFRLPTHGASFGFGTSVLITPTLMGLFEFTPRTGFMLGTTRPVIGPGFTVTGFKHESQPEIGFGVQKNIGKHSFALTFSNTQTTTTSRYNSSNLGFSPRRLVLGFNLARRF